MFLRSRIRRLWTDSLRFHGKPCTLLALGVRVCDTAMTHLGLSDPGLDRLVCVSEHDGCCVDAIQIGLHCTSGRKHLLYYKTGRLIFTVYDLESGASVRICTLPELTDENLTVITVHQTESGKSVRLTKNDEGWVSGGKALPDGIEAIETALAELSFDKCFNYDPSPDAAPLCGLDAPTAVITLAYVNTVGTEATVTLTLGTLREDGTYYATLNDETTVYLLAQEKVASLLALL